MRLGDTRYAHIIMHVLVGQNVLAHNSGPPPSPFRLIAIGAAVLAECPRFVASIHILLFVRGSISGVCGEIE